MVLYSKLILDLEDRKQFYRKKQGAAGHQLLELTVLRLNQLVIQRQYMGKACIPEHPMCGFHETMLLMLPWL